MERRDAGLIIRIVRGCGQKHADAPQRPGLLGAGCKRPDCRRTAEKRDERAPTSLVPHSITSSERAMRLGGRVMPSALAVLRLRVSSNLVGCSIGRSDGLAPLAIRST